MTSLSGYIQADIICPMSVKATLEAIYGGCLNYTVW